MEVAPFFVDFHHFLSIFTIFYRFSRFTHFCRDLHFVAIYALFPQFFLAKIAISATSHVFCMYDNIEKHRQRWSGPNNRILSDGTVCPKHIGIISLWKKTIAFASPQNDHWSSLTTIFSVLLRHCIGVLSTCFGLEALNYVELDVVDRLAIVCCMLNLPKRGNKG